MSGINEIDIQEITKMVYEENRLNSFLEKKHWPYLEDCNCTPEKVSNKPSVILRYCKFMVSNCSIDG